MEVVLECLCPFDYGKGLGDFGNFRCVFILLRLEGLPLNLKILDDVVPMHACRSQVMAHGVVVSNQFAGDSQPFLGFRPKLKSWHWDRLTSSCTWIGIGDSPPPGCRRLSPTVVVHPCRNRRGHQHFGCLPVPAVQLSHVVFPLVGILEEGSHLCSGKHHIDFKSVWV